MNHVASEQDTWNAVDDYFTATLVRGDAALDAALDAAQADAAAAGLPAISVSPPLGKTLALLAGALGATRVLEVGTLAGYSTIWMAHALPPGGRVTTLELDPAHAAVARANIARAGLADRVDLRVGRALDSLAALASENAGPYDLIFIDADKPSNPAYFQWALRLARPGSLIVIDNFVRKGAVADGHSTDASVQGVRRAAELMASEPRVRVTALQTVGGKGYDGFALALVTH